MRLRNNSKISPAELHTGFVKIINESGILSIEKLRKGSLYL